MKKSISMKVWLGVGLSCIALFSCSNLIDNQSAKNDVVSSTAEDVLLQQNDSQINTSDSIDLANIYAQAISDYIHLIKSTYKLNYDTLYFGKHKNGDFTDFPDIELPQTIANTQIRLILPENSENYRNQRISSCYINLIGEADTESANFVFVIFSNDFVHLFDYSINYNYNSQLNTFELDDSHFKTFRFKENS